MKKISDIWYIKDWGENEVMIMNEKTGQSIAAMKYGMYSDPNKDIAYDNPYMVPKYIKKEVIRYFKNDHKGIIE